MKDNLQAIVAIIVILIAAVVIEISVSVHTKQGELNSTIWEEKNAALKTADRPTYEAARLDKRQYEINRYYLLRIIYFPVVILVGFILTFNKH